MRKSIDDTWTYLDSLGIEPPRDADGRPLVYRTMPRFDDELLGLSFFRTQVDGDLSYLTIPRTYFGRTYVVDATFVGTLLTESCMCWNDFTRVDFSGADLTKCDMRASNFAACRFVGASLRGADLRHTSFEGCDFTDADVSGALVDDDPDLDCVYDLLSDDQQEQVIQIDAGPEPDGG